MDHEAPCTRYERVAIAGWAAASCAGDARASWSAVERGASALRREPGIGWVGRLGDRASLLDTAIAIAAPAWESVRALAGRAAWSISASKGDPGQLLAGHLTASLPGALNAPVAAALGARDLVPCPVAAACSTGLYAVLAAADAIEHGRCARGLAGAVDRALEPLVLAGFAAMGVLCGDTEPRAFAAPTGFAPAEGGALLALGPRGPWRLVAGVRLGDATHPTSFGDPRTLRACLAALWRVSPEPALIVTHGTGTAIGDAYESAALDDGPWRAVRRIACKPILGHCLGASGAVELATALEAPVDRLWKIGLGFGGHLAALALQRDSGSPLPNPRP
jgi:hypothetical protein